MTGFKIMTIDKGASMEISRERFSIDQKGITKWLKNKNLISDNETLSSFHDLLPWTRTGGETYCTSFKFVTNIREREINIKAIVTLSPEKSLLDWASRRNILSENEIPVSNWYYFGDAVIIEDFYPKTAREAVTFEKILSIGHKLDELGFATLQFEDDIRSDIEGNPFFIDFGFDLGEPSEIPKTSAKEYLLKNFPEKEFEINNFYNELRILKHTFASNK